MKVTRLYTRTLGRKRKGEFEKRMGKDGGKLVRVGRELDGRKVVENKVIIFFSEKEELSAGRGPGG